MEPKMKKLKRPINNLDQDVSVIKSPKRTKDHHVQSIPLKSSNPVIQKQTAITDTFIEEQVNPLTEKSVNPLREGEVDPLREREIKVVYVSSKDSHREEPLTKKQTYQCGVCNRKFSSLSNVMDHMNIHLGYKCSHCKETLIASTPVSEHIVFNEEAACLLKKWREMESHMCFVDVNTLN